MLGQHLIEGTRLRQRPRVTVHDEATGTVRTVEALGDQIVDHLVGNQSSRFDEGPARSPTGVQVADGRPQQVASADMLQPPFDGRGAWTGCLYQSPEGQGGSNAWLARWG